MSVCYTFRLPDASRKHWLQQQLLLLNTSQQQQHQRAGAAGSRRGSSAGDAVAGFRAAQGLGFSQSLNHGAEDDDEDEVEWDADAPWHPWAQYRDPVKALELDIAWQDRQITTLAAAEQQEDSAAGTSTPKKPQRMPRGSETAAAAAPAAVSAAGMGQLLGDAASGDHWLLHVVQHGFSSSPIRQGRLGMRSADRHRRHVSVAAAGGLHCVAVVREVP
jgi:hypothetical protein